MLPMQKMIVYSIIRLLYKLIVFHPNLLLKKRLKLL